MTEERCDDLYFTYGSTLAGLVATGVLSQPESIDAFHKQAHDPHVVTAPSFDEDTLAAVKRLVTTATNVAVVTAAPEFHGIRCVDALRLRHLLPRVIGSSQLQHLPKTDPATWVRAAELALGRPVVPGQDMVVVIDDHRDNLTAARAAGFIPQCW
jgi:beta-phosphoglucomutase-like phosphatase (HAD superfamily)